MKILINASAVMIIIIFGLAGHFTSGWGGVVLLGALGVFIAGFLRFGMLEAYAPPERNIPPRL